MSRSWSRCLSFWKSVVNGESVRRNRHSFFRPRLNLLEARETPAGVFLGGVTVASGDINGDRFNDIITGASVGAPHVKVYSGQTGQELYSFFAFDPNFTGGVFVAAGDVDGDGKADIIVGAGQGGSPDVRVFSGANGSLIRDFSAFDAGFTGGVRVAAGDVDGDGKADIIVGAGAGGAPVVKVFSGATGAVLQNFNAYDAGFLGGVFVAAGDVNGDGKADVITGAGDGGGPHVKVFSGADGSTLQSFFVFDRRFTGGVHVASGNFTSDNKADIIVGPGAGGSPFIQAFDGSTAAELKNFFTFDGRFSGGAYVAVADYRGTGRVDVITGAGPGGTPLVKGFDNTNLGEMVSLSAYDPVLGTGSFAVESSSNPSTGDTTPPTIQITSPNPGTVDHNVTITGKATDNTTNGVVTVTSRVDFGATSLVSFDANGNFSFTTTFPTDGTVDGAHTITFQATDRAGNLSTPTSVTFTLSTTSPSTLTFDLDDDSDTGVKGDRRTEQETVTLLGTAVGGATVELKSGTTTLDTTTALSDGTFRFENVALGEVTDLTVVSTNLKGEEESVTHTFFHNTAPTVGSPQSNIQVTVGAEDTIINLPGIFNDADVNSQVRLTTSEGVFLVNLFDQQAPETVANFLKYVTDGDYTNSIFHRRAVIQPDANDPDFKVNFVLQGGGFTFQANPADINSIPTDSAVQNEPGLSNQLGTLAMAKLGNNANSATSQFFFNLRDNSRGGTNGPNLDSQNGGFTVFGNLIANGQAVVNALSEYPTQDRSSFSKFPGVFTDIPLRNYPQPPAGNFASDTTAANYALLNSVAVLRRPDARAADALTFSLVSINSSSDASLVTGQIVNNKLVLHYGTTSTGTAIVTLACTDKNGAQVTTEFTVTVVPADTTAPAVQISSPSNGQTFATNPPITGRATDNLGVAQVRVSVDGGATQNVSTDANGNFQFTPSLALDGSANGQHTVTFVARDAAGNKSTPVNVVFNLEADTTAPSVTVTSPANNQTFTTNPPITGTVSDNVAVTSLQASVDGGAAQNVTINGQNQFTFTPNIPTDGSANGSHSVVFTARDSANNVSTPATLTYTLNAADVTAPVVTITSPSDNQTFTTPPAITGTATDNIAVTQFQAVVDSGTPQDVSVDGQGHFTFTPTATADGSHTVVFTARDAAANTSTPRTLHYTIGVPDTAAPVVTITSPANNQTFTSNPPITGTAIDNVGVTLLEATVDSGSPQTVTVNPQGQFTFTPTLSENGSANGSHTVTFVAHDAAGNASTPVSITYTLDAPDTVAPTVSITSPQNNQTFTTNPTIHGVASDNVAVSLVRASVDNGQATSVPFDGTGQFSFATQLATNGSANGVHTVTFIAFDAAGNESTSVTFTFTLNA